MPKAFEFSRNVLKKLTSSNYSLLFDNRFFGVAPRASENPPAFETQPGPISKVNKPATSNTVPATFESWPQPIPPVLKSFRQIQKLLALNGLKFIIQCKIKGIV